MSWRALLVLVAAGLGVGCNNRPDAQIARISGTYDLVLVGRRVFVTSTDRSELRVLDLGADPKVFVPAPNPLEPLSIPVLDRPIGLARDLHYVEGIDVNGASVPQAVEAPGPYVYAISAGAAQISVVGSEELVELKRLLTNDPVTAIAAVGPVEPSGPSTLYYATYDGTSATVWKLALPPPAALRERDVAGLMSTAVRVVPTSALSGPGLAGAAIAALLPLPGDRLVLATRERVNRSPDAGASGGMTTAGHTYWLEADGVTLRELPFGGPVRELATHANAAGRLPGDRIFAVLDEEACGGSAGCTGIVAIDTTLPNADPALLGDIARDASGSPMLPIELFGGIPKGLALATFQPVSLAGEDFVLPVMGVVTSSKGTVFFFDATNMRHIDRDFDDPSKTVTAPARLASPSSEKGLKPDSVLLAAGKIVDQNYLLIFQGPIPGSLGIPRSSDPAAPFALAGAGLDRVRENDLVELLLEGGAPCTTTDAAGGVVPVNLTVTTKTPTGFQTSGEVPAACASWIGFTVRASGEEPYVLVGAVDGFLGRVGKGKSYAFDRPVTYRPIGFDPSVPALRFSMGEDEAGLVRDDFYRLAVTSEFETLSTLPIDPSVSGCSTHQPGSVVLAPDLQRAYIAYPSANGVLEVQPNLVVSNITTQVACYR